MALFNYECDEVKRIIDEVSPNYPQLTTFEKEWLFFHKYQYIPGIPVELECETVSVNPYGSVENAIPFKYKRTILKGNTLVNIKTKYNPSPTPGNWFIAAYDINTLKINTKYLIKLFNKTNIDVTLYPSVKVATGEEFTAKANSIGVGTITTKSEITADLILRLRSSSEDVIGFDCDIILLEYQDGMENWDIPYFEGMKSVQMPVLTTVGKNLFNSNNAMNGYGFSEREVIVKDTWFISNYIEVKPNLSYIISASDISMVGLRVNFYDKDKNFVETGVCENLIIKVPNNNNIFYARTNAKLSIKSSYQIEQGIVATSYEPYKSNILTVNEEVELRGAADVKDELNLLTGELTQHIGEVVLDGSEEYWRLNALWSSDETDYCCFYNSEITKNIIKVLSADKLSAKSANELRDNATNLAISEGIRNDIANIQIFLAKSKLSTIDANGLKQYLQSNPITVQYQLATESVKTVDLTTLTKPYEGTNHYQLSSDIPCEAILEVPVVSTGKQTLEEINN